MYTPLPWRGSTTPSFFRREIASRITVRLTPNCSASTASVGSLPPRAKVPLSICLRSCCATVSLSARAGIFSNITVSIDHVMWSSYKFCLTKASAVTLGAQCVCKIWEAPNELFYKVGEMRGISYRHGFPCSGHGPRTTLPPEVYEQSSPGARFTARFNAHQAARPAARSAVRGIAGRTGQAGRFIRAVVRTRSRRDPRVQCRAPRTDAHRRRHRHRPDARGGTPDPAHAADARLRRSRRAAVPAHAEDSRSRLRLPDLDAVLESRRAGDGRTVGAGSRKLLGSGARPHGDRLCAADAHAQDHDDQPFDWQPSAGVLHVDGPRAARRPRRRHARSHPEFVAALRAHR